MQTQHAPASPAGSDYEEEDFEEEAYGSEFNDDDDDEDDSAAAAAEAEAELDAAARRVQAIQRGRATRTEARQQHQAATMLQARHRGRRARSTRWRTQTQHVLASPVGGDYEQEDFEEEAYGSDFDLEEEMAEAALLSHRSGLSAGEARVQSRCCFGKKVPIIVANLVF
jgi:hypothetical protein